MPRIGEIIEFKDRKCQVIGVCPECGSKTVFWLGATTEPDFSGNPMEVCINCGWMTCLEDIANRVLEYEFMN